MQRDELIGHIYQTAAAPTVWAVALDAIIRASGGAAGVMFFYDTTLATPLCDVTAVGFTSSQIGDYGTYYGARDPRRVWASRYSPPGTTYVDDRDLPFTQIARSETYQDFNRPLGLGACLGGTLFSEHDRRGFLAIHRALDRGPFCLADIAEFSSFLPHVMRALQLRRQLAAAEQRAGILAYALDHMPHATFLVTADGLLLHANTAGLAMLAEAHGALRLAGGRLESTSQRETDRVRRCLRQAVDAAHGHAQPPPILSIAGETGRLAVMVAASPTDTDGRGADLLLVFAATSAARLTADAALLGAQFGLTAAEADVAAELAGGLAPDVVALRRGSSLATVRTQVKAIFSKLGVNSQAQLTAQLARSLAALSDRTQRRD